MRLHIRAKSLLGEVVTIDLPEDFCLLETVMDVFWQISDVPPPKDYTVDFQFHLLHIDPTTGDIGRVHTNYDGNGGLRDGDMLLFVPQSSWYRDLHNKLCRVPEEHKH